MQIDWVTVAAQIVNFLVLAWLLHRFLYGPITRAMERRENAIRTRIEEAEETREQAEARARELEQERAELNARREEILEEAREEARRLKDRLQQEARAEVDELREAWRAELDEDRNEFLAAMRTEAREGFRTLADDALRALADTTLTERMAEAFAARVGDLDEVDAERLRGAVRRGEGLVITLGSDVSGALRGTLTAAVRKAVGDEVEIDIPESSDDFTGIRLKAGGETLDWTLDAHLDRFADRLASAFPTEDARETQDDDANGGRGAGDSTLGDSHGGTAAGGKGQASDAREGAAGDG
ncbi:hypothetical protein H0I76_10055 [Limibaculum sp. M0105]|uniref:ATP synthase subunit b n=1 Tax=Thermohalobaculum xanthum TaxID=2753746 RepID=A0A8J7M7A9_9RHOB|nr:hypothetical protein [Thermohalobaculum xanthum]MBK0399535.1 hypothetical protein [Thermohalobaculum xanthum]